MQPALAAASARIPPPTSHPPSARPPPPHLPPRPRAPGPRRAEVEAALSGADVFFGSLLFDYDQVEWLRERVAAVPVRLVFESALELMGCTQVGAAGGRALAGGW